ncbi:MAG: hypothetical protein HC830_03705, partial [Bacteroidetes bacterium]|nr:hypothetical protein [Bacteroidota bacterium]
MNIHSGIKLKHWKILTMLFICLGLIVSVSGQKALTLDDAMQIAVKNSPEIIKSELNMTISKENLKAREAATKS